MTVLHFTEVWHLENGKCLNSTKFANDKGASAGLTAASVSLVCFGYLLTCLQISINFSFPAIFTILTRHEIITGT
jgi:hypothetical protein